MARANPVRGFAVDTDDITFVGSGLQRPECVLCTDDGALWISDARGGLTHIDPQGQQRLVLQSMDGAPNRGSRPNGLAMTATGDLLVANMGTRSVERTARDGVTRTLLSSVDGQPLGQVNFVLRDARDRLWVTVSTRRETLFDAFRPGVADGYVVLVDDAGPRIVADGLGFPNEVRTDPACRSLWVAETTARRIRRFSIGDDGSLVSPETVGPADLGPGFPDGIAVDAHGNLWVAMIGGERVVALGRDGTVETLLDAGTADAVAAVEDRFGAGTLTGEDLAAAAGPVAPLTTSIAFGGRDLKTVYLGSLMGQRVASFRSPVAGAPMSHWRH